MFAHRAGHRLLTVFTALTPLRGKVTWVRKPLALGTAKSKVFRVPRKPDLPQDETREIKRIYDIYKTQMKSIRQYFVEQEQKQADTGEAAQLQAKKDEDEFHRLIEENCFENKVTAVFREAKLRELEESMKEKVALSLARKQERDRALMEEISTTINKEENAAVSFISRDDIQMAIEEALASPQDFNFAVDLSGKVYRGTEKVSGKRAEGPDEACIS
nr:EOG090X0FQ9 [Leptodora kindtii]